jgi:hypothetical protein
MNKKIRELANQADIIKRPNTSGRGWDYTIKENQLEAFADLILQVAMEVVRDEVAYHSDWDCADNAVTKVKEHFGIE